MKTQASKRPLPLVLIIGIAVILFSAAGTAAITSWGPAASGGSSESLAPGDLPATAAEAIAGINRTKTRCPECGVIASRREIEAGNGGFDLPATGEAATGHQDGIRARPVRYYEFTVHMTDNTIRLINDANPANWRIGERVVVIDGVSPSTP